MGDMIRERYIERNRGVKWILEIDRYSNIIIVYYTKHTIYN